MRSWRLNRAAVIAAFSVLTVILSLCTCRDAVCQVNLESQGLTEMYHTAWTVREGAPSNINASVQTADGYLWLGTDGGLFRFDGVSFEHYLPVAGDEFLPGLVESLLATPDGGLWISYPSGEVSYLKNGHNKNYGRRDGTPHGNILGFALAPDGAVWAASAGGLMRHGASGWEHVEDRWKYPEKYALSVYFDHRGTLWVGSGKQLLYLPAGQHAFHVALNAHDDTYSVAESPQGVIWVALHQASELRAITSPNGTLLKEPFVLHGYKTPHPHFARDGSFWIPTDDDGLFRIPASVVRAHNPAEWPRFAEHMSRANGLTSNSVFEAVEDMEGSFWLPTNKGLDQFRVAALTNIPVPDEFNRVAIVSDGAGGVIASGLGGAKSLHVHRDGTTKLIPGPADILCAYRDPKNVIWLGGQQGLWRGAAESFAEVPLPTGVDPANNWPIALTEDAKGNLWAYFLRKGAYRLQNGVWTQPEQLREAVQEGSPVEVTDGAGRVWFGLRGNRIKVFDHEKLTRYGPESGLNVADVITLHAHGDQLWVGGELGLEYLKGSRFRRLHLIGDQPLVGVSGIVQTQNGDLWLSSAAGIVFIPASEIDIAQTDPEYKARFTIYNYLDGLVGTAHQERPTPSVIQATDGRLWFGTRTGLAWMNPSKPATRVASPRVFITSVLADGVRFRDPNNLQLRTHTTDLQINYTSTSLMIPQRLRFRYKLEGFDNDWQDAGTRREAFYSRLPPGTYRFEVMASNTGGLWDEPAVNTTFTIPPSFFQGSWFKAVCIGLFVCLLGLMYRLRIRAVTKRVRTRLYERLAERERIARDLHDTFFQGIQGLLLRFNTGTAQLREGEPAKVIFEEALQQSDRVMLEGRELVHDLRTGFGELQSLGTALADAGIELKQKRQVDFRVTLHGEQQELHPLVFEEVYRIGREALANAFRHSQASAIEAELNYGTQEMRVRIRDNGTGLESHILLKGNRENHWGLPGMRERARNIGGQIDFWSRKGEGTEIELRVPAILAYRSIAPKHRFASLRRLWHGDAEL